MSIVNQLSHMGDYNDYECFGEIGRGSYGTVYKAKCKKSNRIVALKEVVYKNENEGFPIATLTEITCQPELNHDNIVKLLGMCQSSKDDDSYRSQFYLIFEFCDYDLRKILNDEKIQLNLEHIKCIMFKILSGLRFLHSNKIIHRDLKPENILITKLGEVKLGDFGLSKMLDPTQASQSKRDTNGYVTQWYRAPELLLNDNKYGKSVDMWSVGCIFPELWTRKPIMPCKCNSYKCQLQLIRALCGDIKWPGIDKLKSYNQLKSDNQSKSCLEKYPQLVVHYRDYIPEKLAVDLIDQLLTLNPQERINVDKAIHSPFLESQLPSVLESLFSDYPKVIKSTGKRIQDEDNNQQAKKKMKFPPANPVY